MSLEQRRAVYNVDGQALTFVKAESYKGPLLVNTFGAYTLELRFSREWKEFDRIALYLQAAGAAGITLDLKDPLNAQKLSETDTQVIYLVNVPSQILKSIGQITVGVTGYKSEDTSFRFPTTLDSSFKVTQSTPNMEAEVLPQQVSVVEKIFLQLYAQLGGVVSQEQIQAAVNQAITEGKISNYDDTEIKSDIKQLKSTLGLNETLEYKNAFYNSSYSDKTVNNDYPYQAFGTGVPLTAGNYLVYINADFTITSLNCRPFTCFVTETNVKLGNFDDPNSPNPVITTNATSVDFYNIVTLDKDYTSVRPGLNMRYVDTSVTPAATIKINNIFVCKLDTINSDLIAEIKAKGNSSSVTVTKTATAKITKVDCIGDSLTYGVGSSATKGGYVTRLQSKLGETFVVSNYGVGGETSHTIAARMGGIRPIIKAPLTIPATTTASGQFKILCDNGADFDTKDLTISNACVNPCEINGIKGTLAKVSSTTNTYTFTREEAGDEVTISRDTTLVTAGSKRKGNILIIYMGQNDGNYNADYQDLVKRCRRIVNVAETSKYLILGMTTGSYNTGGDDDRKNMEEAMFKEFGSNYINLREYMAHPIYDTDGSTLISCYSLDDLGLTASSNDLTGLIPNGYIPSDMITTDGTHGTDGYYDIVANLVYNRGKELGYWN